jgi:O-antigen/teichoic acid export membrane protein
MTKSNFHEASRYVFYIALIPLAQLFYFMMGTGVEFAKSPIYRPFVSGAALLTVVLTNSFLIKKLGIAGAALSITAGWSVMAIATYIYAQSLYRIKYNWGVVLLYLAFTIAVCYFLNGVGNNYLAWKIVISLILLFGICYLAIFKYRVVNILRRRNEA